MSKASAATQSTQAAPSSEKADPSLAPCIMSAVVWFALTLYLFLVVPREFSALGAVTANMPAGARAVLGFYDAYGTTICAVVGLIGCCLAYALRSVRLANVMVLTGTVAILLLVLELVTHKQPLMRESFPIEPGMPARQ